MLYISEDQNTKHVVSSIDMSAWKSKLSHMITFGPLKLDQVAKDKINVCGFSAFCDSCSDSGAHRNTVVIVP